MRMGNIPTVLRRGLESWGKRGKGGYWVAFIPNPKYYDSWYTNMKISFYWSLLDLSQIILRPDPRSRIQNPEAQKGYTRPIITTV